MLALRHGHSPSSTNISNCFLHQTNESVVKLSHNNFRPCSPSVGRTAVGCPQYPCAYCEAIPAPTLTFRIWCPRWIRTVITIGNIKRKMFSFLLSPIIAVLLLCVNWCDNWLYAFFCLDRFFPVIVVVCGRYSCQASCMHLFRLKYGRIKVQFACYESEASQYKDNNASTKKKQLFRCPREGAPNSRCDAKASPSSQPERGPCSPSGCVFACASTRAAHC